MNPTTLPPLDLETLAIEYASARPAILELVGDAERVSGRLPRGWTKGDVAVRMTRVGGMPVDHLGHLDRCRLQVEAFAGDDLEACALAGRVLVELRTLEGQKVDGGVVTAVDQDLGLRRQPDPITDAPRYLFGVVLYGHPTAT